MAPQPTDRATGLRLFGFGPEGPREVVPPAGARDLHGAFEGLPTGVYEALRTFGGDRFLRLEAHLDRADASAAGAGLTRRIDRPLLRRGLAEVLRPGDPDVRVRFDLSDRETPLPDGAGAVLWLALGPLPDLPPAALTRGVSVRTGPGLARERPTIKSAAWARQRERCRGGDPGGSEAYETVLLDSAGRILEGASSNLFFVRGDALVTAGEEVLAGITRGLVLELAPGVGLATRRELLSVEEALACDEAFLTSASRGPVPVTSIDERPVGAGRPGARTLALRRAWAELAHREARPAWPASAGE